MTEIAAGKRLRSQACGTEVIVVRAPDQPVELTCGGSPMTAEPAAAGPRPPPPPATAPSSASATSTSRPGSSCSAPSRQRGAGRDGRELALKTAKPLPASD